MKVSKEGRLADEVLAIIAARHADSPFALDIAPQVVFRVDFEEPPVGERRCYILPGGFDSERINRSNGKERTYYVDVILVESMPINPMSDDGTAWLDIRYLLVEQIEELDFSEVSEASWEDSSNVNLFFESANADNDQLFFQVVRLEFRD